MSVVSETVDPKGPPVNTSLVLALAATAEMIIGSDFSLASVALPSIERGLSLAPSSSQWVISADMLTYAGFLIVGGRMADRFGQRRVVMLGLSLFLVGSALTSLAAGLTLLVIARAVQGIGAALTYPAALSLLTITFPEGPLRFRAYTISMATAAVGVPLYTIAVGGIITRFGWQSAFLLNVPFCACLIYAFSRLAAIDRQIGDRVKRLPVFDAVLLTLGVAAVVYALMSHFAQTAYGDGYGRFAPALGIGILAIFGIRQFRSSAPLIPPALLRIPNFAAGVAGVAFMVLAGKGLVVLSNISLQKGLHFTAFAASLALLPMSISSLMLIPVSARASRFLLPYAKWAICGAFATIGVFCVSLAVTQMSFALIALMTVTFFAPFFTVTGVNLMLWVSLRDVPNASQGVATAIIYTFVQIIGAVGMAVVIAASGSAAKNAGDFDRFSASFLTNGAIALFGLTFAALALRSRSRSIDATSD
jgi:MFS family permease